MGKKEKHPKLRRRQVNPGEERLNDPNDYEDPKWPYSQGKMDWSAIIFSFTALVVIVALLGYFWQQAQLRERVYTPLDTPKIIAPEATLPKNDPSRFWGSYRPQNYFGLKTRSQKSPVFGLMWFSQFSGIPPTIRHWCNQGDGLLKYGWTAHDGVNFGVQEIHDHHYSIVTEFVKRAGGSHGGDWTTRIRVLPRPGSEKAVVSLLFYGALDGDGQIVGKTTNGRLDSLSGHSKDVGNFRVSFPKPKHGLKKSNYMMTYAAHTDKLKDMVMAGFQWQPYSNKNKYLALAGHVMPQDVQADPNYYVHQVTVTLPFEMEVVYESGSFLDRPNQLAGDIFQAELENHLKIFDERFEKTFQLQKRGYSTREITAAKAIMSNMVGGIGYFYGQALVKSKYNAEPVPYWPSALYTGVPSRSFFPRGFLWDEGFHNLLISKWDPEISKDIIGHWLDLMNKEGWIPREQILGLEARAKVPDEFVVQRNENANPPTLFLPLQSLIKDMIKSDKVEDQRYLKALFPRLKAWYDWFNTTQHGALPFTYQWRGRDKNTVRELNPKTLTSGLDDYPRASHPTDNERHLDLRCWMALASGVMSDIAKTLKESSQAYSETYKLLQDNKLLDKLHWSQKGQMYADFGLHTNNVRLDRPQPPKNLRPGERPPPMSQEKIRITRRQPTERYVDSFGYVSLFPFIVQIIEPNSLKLGKVLDDLQDPNLLWTKYGLRSLAKSAPLYNKYNTEHDPPYWRGAIWVNINYLTVRALHHYSMIEGPYKDRAKQLYQELRNNLVKNILKEYERTGYIWEQYEDTTGQGKGSHPFTGWSALVVLMMAEEY